MFSRHERPMCVCVCVCDWITDWLALKKKSQMSCLPTAFMMRVNAQNMHFNCSKVPAIPKNAMLQGS